MISPNNKLTLQQIKSYQASKLREEKLMMKSQKEKEEKSEISLRNKKKLELEKLEQAYLEALNSRSRAKDISLKKPKKYRINSNSKVDIKTIKNPYSVHYELDPKLFAINSGMKSNNNFETVTNYYDFPIAIQKKISDPLEPTASDSPINIEQVSEDLLQKTPKLKLQKRSKALPLVLKPLNSDVFSIHILGELQKSPKQKMKSCNLTPTSEKDSETEGNRNFNYHLFRDDEILSKVDNFIENSKQKAMQEYGKNTVKRYFTPKPSINKKIQVESMKLKKDMKEIMHKMQFYKLFKNLKLPHELY